MVNVAQLVRALDCGSKGRGFEPHLSPLQEEEFLKKKEIPLFCICTIVEVIHNLPGKRYPIESGKIFDKIGRMTDNIRKTADKISFRPYFLCHSG